MAGGTNLQALIKNMTPKLNEGSYVFVTVKEPIAIDRTAIICEFKEPEGATLILDKHKADELNLTYDYIAAWITLTVHSSLDAVGLTAAFSNELAKHQISCNVIAAYYHDHIFVAEKDAQKAIEVLLALSKSMK
jgi:uncharacterized protein